MMRNVVKSKLNGRRTLPIPRNLTLSEGFVLARPFSMYSQQPTFRGHPDPDQSSLHSPCFSTHNAVYRLRQPVVFGKSEHRLFGRNYCSHLLPQQFFAYIHIVMHLVLTNLSSSSCSILDFIHICF
jgi:hypothetical protein